MSESSAPLFGLVTPAHALDDEEVFIPMCMSSRHGPLSPAYSPYPLHPDEAASGSSCALSDRPAMILADNATDVVAKRKERKRKHRRQQRLLRRHKSLAKPHAESSTFLREGKRVYEEKFDPYYADRFLTVAECDKALFAAIEALSSHDVGLSPKSAKVLDCSHGGNGWPAFCLAAMFGARRVVSVHPDLETVLANCKQLRKLKHDGIVWREERDQYPKYVVRRMGPVRVSNKPWVRPLSLISTGAETAEGVEDFPFNIEFRCGDITEDETQDVFDLVVCLHMGQVDLHKFTKSIVARTKIGGLIISDNRECIQNAFVETLCGPPLVVLESALVFHHK